MIVSWERFVACIHHCEECCLTRRTLHAHSPARHNISFPRRLNFDPIISGDGVEAGNYVQVSTLQAD